MIKKNHSDLTLLCPIKDRFDYLERFLNFLIISNCKYKIYIADGSKNLIDSSLINKAQKYLNIEYKKFEFDESWFEFLNKMYLSLRDINTLYTCLVCDDDFYDIAEIDNAINFLNKNNDFVSYSAEVVDFNIITNAKIKIYGEISIKDENRCCSRRYESNLSVISDNISLRLENYLKIWPYENITKTKILLDIFEISKNCKIENYHHLIQVFRIIILLNGNIYYSNKPFTLRQSNTFSSTGADLLNIYPTQLHFLSKSFNSVIEDNMIDYIINYIEKNYFIDKTNIIKSIYYCFIQNYRNSIQRDFLIDNIKKENKIHLFSKKFKNRINKYFISTNTSNFENINTLFLKNINTILKLHK
jgi:glycosyltransferase domain-containing protein